MKDTLTQVGPLKGGTPAWLVAEKKRLAAEARRSKRAFYAEFELMKRAARP